MPSSFVRVCWPLIEFEVTIDFWWFLANVNSRSRSLFAVARPSVCHLSVCRL